MKTWLADFQERTELNKYPVALRTRGGIGYQTPDGIVSTFVGHRVHYLESGIWKPITLKHDKGNFEGSDFGWKGGQVTYKKKSLFRPKAVIFNGVRYNLNLRLDGTRVVASLPFGEYEVRFTEGGVKELLTIPEPVDAVIEFDVPHSAKPDKLYKIERHIVGGIFGEIFTLTKDMQYPVVIDPDYAAHAADGYVYGDATSYATARTTSTGFSIVTATLYIGQQYYTPGTNYQTRRSYLKYDTSGIPDGDTVTQANATLYCTAKDAVTFNINLVKQDWSAQDPITSGNMEAAYDNCLAGTTDALWQSTASVTAGNAYTSSNLDTTRVSKTGYTYYGVRSSKDESATAPTGNEYLQVASQDNVTAGFRPILTVVHAPAASGFFF